MRIAQIAPLFESVPPQMYGGTERVVSVLTEELVSRGHVVTLFASGDSATQAKLAPCAKRSLRLDGTVTDHVALTTIELARVFDREAEFDIIHNHVDYFAFPFARQSRTPMVTTTHGRLDLDEIRNVYDYFAETPLVSISDAQREPLPASNWLGTVHNGIDFSLFKLHPAPGKYLAFLGRISPEKRPDRAIEIARALDMPLKIAAKVDEVDKDYFEHVVRPHMSHPLIEFVGEVGDKDKNEFLGNAYAYLFPIDWPEPFGLTMVEAMACGTPVVATNCGSVGEIVKDGVSGYVCRSLRELIDSVAAARKLDRSGCRAYAEAHFSAGAMADGYERIYQNMHGQKTPLTTPTQAAGDVVYQRNGRDISPQRVTTGGQS
jgi:glycosyltransferase involved in cell wall biosynthesis